MIKSTVIKLFISALVATAPVPTTAYTSTGIYYADGTPVVITFDSQGTDSRYDDVVTGLTTIEQ